MVKIVALMCLTIVSWCLFAIFCEGHKQKPALFFALIGMYFFGGLAMCGVAMASSLASVGFFALLCILGGLL